MWLLYALFIGLIIGAVARFFMPGRDPGGIVVTMFLGIGGSMFAGWLGSTMGFYMQGEPAGFIASVIGAMLLLVIYRMIAGRKI